MKEVNNISKLFKTIMCALVIHCCLISHPQTQGLHHYFICSQLCPSKIWVRLSETDQSGSFTQPCLLVVGLGSKFQGFSKMSIPW